MAWALFGANVAMLCVALVLVVLNRHAPDLWSPAADPFLLAGAPIYGGVGALIATRRPDNAIGWLYLAFGLITQGTGLAAQWAVYGLETRPGLPGAALALWASLWLGAVVLGLGPTFPLLLFPAGRLVNRRTRVVAWLSGLALVWALLVLMTGTSYPPGFPELFETTPNPLALGTSPLGDPGVPIMLLGLCALASVALLLGRFQRSRGAERQQYKWIVSTMALVVVGYLVDFFARALWLPAAWLTGPFSSLTFALVPLAIGVAILRRQLFDIDHVINRALVYAALSAALVGAYVVGVVLLQRLLDPLTRGSDLAVAATTLLVAAAARPLRDRVQATVDRRFNRRRYDAARTLDAFAVRLRAELDLDTLAVELGQVVNETMQPSFVSIWMLPTEEPPGARRRPA